MAPHASKDLEGRDVLLEFRINGLYLGCAAEN